MRQLTFEVFAKTDQFAQLRLLGTDNTGIKLLGERELTASEIQSFVREVEDAYRVEALNHAKPPALVELGKRLYAWLDGPTERWLANAHTNAQGLAVHIDVAEQLRHLPWELLFGEGGFLCHNAAHPFTPARRVAQTQRTQARENRPLRLLFMACSAENVQPLLSYESEEMGILAAAGQNKIELVVEESGSLAGLKQRVSDFGDDGGQAYFDVFHLTGHADVRDGKPIFWMEDDFGYGQAVSAEEIAQAFAGNWPRLVFLSGCKTAQAVEQGVLPSFCEALVAAGAPAVLGWALPVLDRDASLAAAALYQHLAAGKRLDESIARARQHLLEQQSSEWHLLRLYADATPLSELVTPLKTKDRKKLQYRAADSVFLDAGRSAGKIEVCGRAEFVGRRRPLQRCLRALTRQQGDDHYAEGVLLHGTGGLGKSSLAVRLCERLPDHRRIVLVAAYDELAFLNTVSAALMEVEANRLLSEPLPLAQRLRKLLESDVLHQPALFVFDDFEHNLEADRRTIKPAALEILTALLSAIHDTASDSRVIVTCRYQFALSGNARLHEEGLESLRAAELRKKLRQLNDRYRFDASKDDLRHRAQELGAGNPRLLERLYKVLADTATDHEAIFAALAQTAEQFREDVLLRKLLDLLPAEGRRLVALVSLYDLPVERDAVAAVADALPLEPHLARAVALSLIEAGTLVDPQTHASTHRYFVSEIVRPLLTEELSETEQTAAQRRAAQHLYQHWWAKREHINYEEDLEIHRLALLTAEKDIAVEIGNAIAGNWVNSSQYREAEMLCRATLDLGEDYRILHTLARAEVVLGKTNQAVEHFETALAQALPVAPGSETFAESQEPAAIIHNLAGVIAQQGDVTRALNLWQQSLALLEQIGDVKGKAATLHQMAGVIAQQGDVTRALNLWQQSLALKEQIGDVQGKAATLANMAWLAGKQGNVAEERRLNLEAVQAFAQVGAWLYVVTVLGNLGAGEDTDARDFLAQALWLTLRVEVPAEAALNLTAALLTKLGVAHESAPRLAMAAVVLMQTRGANHPEQEKLVGYAFNMLGACAQARQISEDDFLAWLEREGLRDPDRFLPALLADLEAMVSPDAWLFDRRQVTRES